VNACVHTYTKPQTSSTRSRGLGWRIHGSVEDTKLSTNKQPSLSQVGAAETRTPYRGDQEPGTTIQARAAAEGHNIENNECYKNVHETDEDAL